MYDDSLYANEVSNNFIRFIFALLDIKRSDTWEKSKSVHFGYLPTAFNINNDFFSKWTYNNIVNTLHNLKLNENIMEMINLFKLSLKNKPFVILTEYSKLSNYFLKMGHHQIFEF